MRLISLHEPIENRFIRGNCPLNGSWWTCVDRKPHTIGGDLLLVVSQSSLYCVQFSHSFPSLLLIMFTRVHYQQSVYLESSLFILTILLSCVDWHEYENSHTSCGDQPRWCQNSIYQHHCFQQLLLKTFTILLHL